MKITKRDLSFFILGILTLLTIQFALNWEDAKNSFIEGFNDGYNGKYHETDQVKTAN